VLPVQGEVGLGEPGPLWTRHALQKIASPSERSWTRVLDG
jgi:hypothetical protein